MQLTRQRGFTLIELALVLMIIGLLIGGLVTGTARFVEQSKVRKAEAELRLIEEALIGFTLANGRLPCPDVDNPPDGVEDRQNTPAECVAGFGRLPAESLGLAMRDPWETPYRYRVDPSFADDPTPSFTLNTAGNLDVHEGFPTNTANRIAENVPAVFFSVGANRADSQAEATDPEDENLDTLDNDFLAMPRQPYDPNDQSVGFDDVVRWLSPHVLKARMAQAGVLP